MSRCEDWGERETGKVHLLSPIHNKSMEPQHEHGRLLEAKLFIFQAERTRKLLYFGDYLYK